jgi:hypothetical protein
MIGGTALMVFLFDGTAMLAAGLVLLAGLFGVVAVYLRAGVVGEAVYGASTAAVGLVIAPTGRVVSEALLYVGFLLVGVGFVALYSSHANYPWY